jgi:hypothetical protein
MYIRILNSSYATLRTQAYSSCCAPHLILRAFDIGRDAASAPIGAGASDELVAAVVCFTQGWDGFSQIQFASREIRIYTRNRAVLIRELTYSRRRPNTRSVWIQTRDYRAQSSCAVHARPTATKCTCSCTVNEWAIFQSGNMQKRISGLR